MCIAVGVRRGEGKQTVGNGVCVCVCVCLYYEGCEVTKRGFHFCKFWALRPRAIIRKNFDCSNLTSNILEINMRHTRDLFRRFR